MVLLPPACYVCCRGARPGFIPTVKQSTHPFQDGGHFLGSLGFPAHVASEEDGLPVPHRLQRRGPRRGLVPRALEITTAATSSSTVSFLLWWGRGAWMSRYSSSVGIQSLDLLPSQHHHHHHLPKAAWRYLPLDRRKEGALPGKSAGPASSRPVERVREVVVDELGVGF